MIEIRELTFGYGKEKLFDGLDLSVAPGNIYGLLGKNGAGKTSLLRIVSGLLFPDRGRCSVLGADPVRRLPSMLNSIFSVPEEFILPGVKPVEYVTMLSPFYPLFDRGAFDRYFSEFQLMTDKKLTAYSYGQKKKFLLAFGLATNCPILLLDEPTNGLDIPSKSQFRRTVASALTEERTFIISTHQVRDMENLIDPVIILDEGRIIFNDDLESVAKKVSITLERDEPASAGTLYSEKVLGGYTVVRRSSGGEETAIDLEVLFSLVTSGNSEVGEILGKEAIR